MLQTDYWSVTDHRSVNSGNVEGGLSNVEGGMSDVGGGRVTNRGVDETRAGVPDTRAEAGDSRAPVRQATLPDGARTRSTLAHVDYEDCFVVDVPDAFERTAEAWARAVLEDAPAAVRTSLRAGWSALGLRPARGPRSILGWEIRRVAPDYVLLGATSRLGMQGELLLERHPGELLFATLVQHDNPLVRVVWAGIEATHLRVVRSLLEQARTRWA